LGSAFGLHCVRYTRDKFIVDSQECYGSICKSYLNANDLRTTTLYNILQYFNINIPMNMSAVDYFNITVDCVHKYTGLNIEYIQNYIMQLLVFDFIIANNDRHLSNIEIIQNSNSGFRFAPIFDCGQSFFRKDRELTYSQLDNESRKFKAKPFSTNQYKNLINIDYAKNIAYMFNENAKKSFGGIYNIPDIPRAHKKVAIYRMKLLLNK
jgi:hypothetical protein